MRWSGLRRNALAAAFAVLATWPVAAQTQNGGSEQQQWLALTGRVIEAQKAGDFAQGTKLAEEALKLARKAFGERAPQTLGSLNNLAVLYVGQGRYGEAEPLYRDALQAMRETLGPRHQSTLQSLSNLAVVYYQQGRFGEAEPLFREALQARREVLGPRHPDTLQSLNNLAGLYQRMGRYGDAEPLLREALQAYRETLGPRHPATLQTLNNLAILHVNQGRYDEAEPLYREALQTSREVLGPRHPDTLISLNNLAVLYFSQGRYGDAELLFREALQAKRDVLGPRHPDTLTSQINLAQNLIDQDRRIDAVRLLQQMEPDVLGWIGQELHSTEAGAARRQLMSSQANFQDVVMTLAVAPRRGGDEQRLAARVMLRFKFVQGEEEGYLARLARRSQDPHVRTLADEVIKLRTALSAAAQGEPGAFDKALQALEAKQHALSEASGEFRNYLRVQAGNLNDVRAALPAGAVLIEFRQYRPDDFRTGRVSEPHFAAMLLSGFEEPVVVDLGPVSALHLSPRGLTDANAAAIYRKLFAPFEQKIADARTVYLAPDGILALVPFAQLKLADGRYWAERQEVRALQTGRDLLHPPGANDTPPARGLLALGGIDFDADAAATGGETSASVLADAAGANRGAAAIARTADTFRSGFPALPATADEANAITSLYRQMRAGEPAEMWSGAGAGKARLLALKAPPRVLHLATHGFYLPNNSREPMLQAGIALSGANRQLAGKGTDGILFALEAQGLNLDGTALVVLSACDTAQGNVDYSEGVFGLARALRIAGARNVVVTLRELNDGAARDFMVAFYKNWLGQSRSDPAKALRETQLAWIRDGRLSDPALWAPYVVIE